MSSEKGMTVEEKVAENGKIIFAPDVVATIAGLAATEIKGIAGMSSGMVDGIAQMLGRKNLTKGVKVEVGAQEAAVDVSVIVLYGHRIHEVCREVQAAIKQAIETMTGLKVVQVNVMVQAVSFEKEPKEPKPEKIKEKPEKVKEKPEKGAQGHRAAPGALSRTGCA